MSALDRGMTYEGVYYTYEEVVCAVFVIRFLRWLVDRGQWN